jgi:hypothetical protein
MNSKNTLSKLSGFSASALGKDITGPLGVMICLNLILIKGSNLGNILNSFENSPRYKLVFKNKFRCFHSKILMVTMSEEDSGGVISLTL